MTDDQAHAKTLAQRLDYRHAVLRIAHDRDRPAVQTAIEDTRRQRQAHRGATGWTYRVGNEHAPGYWIHETYPYGPDGLTHYRKIQDTGDQP